MGSVLIWNVNKKRCFGRWKEFVRVFHFVNGLCHNYKNALNVILNEVKNLIFTIGYKIKILRLAPQNDIVTPPAKVD